MPAPLFSGIFRRDTSKGGIDNSQKIWYIIITKGKEISKKIKFKKGI